MKDRTPSSSVLTRISDAIRRAADVVHARSDRRAVGRGWEVTVTGRRGIRRSYRDPRFDTLASCPRCGGEGRTPAGGECARCYGTGRIVHDPSRRAAG